MVSKILDTSTIKISDLNILTNELTDVYIVYIDDIKLGNAVGDVHFELFRLKISNFIKLSDIDMTLNCPIELIDISIDYYDSSTLIETSNCIKNEIINDIMDDMIIPSYQYVICDLLNLLNQSIFPWDDFKWRKRLDRLSLMLLYHIFDQKIEHMRDDLTNIEHLFDNIRQSNDELMLRLSEMDEILNSQYFRSLIKIYQKIIIMINYFKNPTELSNYEQQMIMPYIEKIRIVSTVDGILNKPIDHYFEYVNSEDNQTQFDYFRKRVYLMIMTFKDILI